MYIRRKVCCFGEFQSASKGTGAEKIASAASAAVSLDHTFNETLLSRAIT